ncbi:NAD-dependent epimerase/dehydratase family protein [bacterium]|nr:NAD-dependent epimerase/dehydratase family protein [bacterium]
MTTAPNIVIAGASGYIGRALIPRIKEKWPEAKIFCLSRASKESSDPHLIWRGCDLFSLKSIENALPERVDAAVYLVHSMAPTAKLDQGNFADYDLILADNFAKVLKERKCQQLVYLGGLMPETAELSLHLKSRHEVEEVFHERELKLTCFRAGLILGEEGSSAQMLFKLVERLPVMLCPGWTQTHTTPVDLPAVAEALADSILKPEHQSKVYDLAGCPSLTYADMMKQTAQRMGRKRWFVPVPFFTPTLSRLWVSLITNSPKELVYPLIDSLKHKMTARSSHLYPHLKVYDSYKELLAGLEIKIHKSSKVYSKSSSRTQARKTVRSVQRLPLPEGKDSLWVRKRYVQWLPRFMRPFIKVRIKEDIVSFSLLTTRFPLLELRVSPERSSDDRQLMYVGGGLLVKQNDRGRLEFRTILNRKYVLAAIHDFVPALPWYVYRFTQAKIHLWVMHRFGAYMEKKR